MVQIGRQHDDDSITYYMRKHVDEMLLGNKHEYLYDNNIYRDVYVDKKIYYPLKWYVDEYFSSTNVTYDFNLFRNRKYFYHVETRMQQM